MNQAVQPQMFVDGNNVMGSRPDGWWRDRAGAARRIVAEIALLARNRKGVWTVVFDGPGPCGTEPSPEYLTVIYAGHGGRDSADDRIVELVGALPGRAMALVYTSDAALRAFACDGRAGRWRPGTAEGYRRCTYLDHRLAEVDLGMARRMMQRQ